MHILPVEGNFYDKHGKAHKHTNAEGYEQHMGYANKGDRTANSYSVVG
jgi:hypothetical protein